ncbi:MAG: glycosyltransferase family 4 protein [Cyanobacteria bacterium P01_D01_bin.44]
MRIAYLTGTYPRVTDTFIQREVAVLRENGMNVHTFSVRQPDEQQIVGPEQKEEREGTFYLLPPNLGQLAWAHLRLIMQSPGRYIKAVQLAWQTHQPGIKGTLYQLFYFAEAGLLSSQICDRNIQHLHNHFGNSSCTVAMLASALGGFSYSFTMHGPSIFFEPKHWKIDEKIKRALFVVCISDFCRSQAMVFSPYSMWDKMHIVHCGVNPSQFLPATHQGVGYRLLFVGRLAAVKGLPILLEGLRILKQAFPNIILTLVGDGPDRTMLESQTAQLGLGEHVRFVGYKSQAEVRQYLQETDVFVLPSFAEGVPVCLMESMASGVPVIATAIAGVSELVEDGVSGYVIPPGNANLLAERIEALLRNPQLRETFGLAGRSKVTKEFNLSAEARRFCLVLTSSLAGKKEAIRPELKHLRHLQSSQTA